MTRKEILEAAEKCVCGDREQDYGSPERWSRLRFCRTISHRHVRLTSSPVSVRATVYPSPSQSGQSSEVSSHVAVFRLPLLPTAFLLPVNSATILLLR